MNLGPRRIGALVTTAITLVGLAGTVAISPRVAAAGSHRAAAGGIRQVAGVTIVVNETADEVVVTPLMSAPLVCLTASLKCSLRAAIQVANFDSANGLGPDTITFDPTVTGPYTLTIPPTGPMTASNDDITSGDLNVTGTMTITGNGAPATVIDGNSKDRVFRVELGGSLTASKLTVQHGKVVGSVGLGNNAIGACGGGILSYGTLVLSDAMVASNACQATGRADAGDGGGIDTAQRLAGDTPPSTTLTRVSIDGNSAPFGGGVSQDTSQKTVGGARTTITDSSVTNNVATNVVTALFVSTGGGGGVHENGGTVAMLRTRVTGNTAGTIGGGVYEDGGGAVTLTDSVASSNTASTYAGGVLEDGGGVLTLLRTTVDNNTAGSYAGGMYLDGGGVDTIDSSRVTNNHALGGTGGQIFPINLTERGAGGGIVEDGGGPGHTTISHTTISGNAASHGAGVYIAGGSPGFTITASTISGNVATPLRTGGREDGYGGGLLSDNGDAVTITNSTISGNAGGTHGGGVVTLPRQLSQSFTSVRATRSASRAQHRQAFIPTPDQPVLISNSTIAGNTTTDTKGAAVDNGLAAGVLTLHDDILAGTGKVCSGGGTSTGGNVDGDATCPTVAGDKSNADALLQPLADNPPGLTQTRLVAEGSPAIGAGTSCPATDQRDQPRPSDGCTSGAVEYQRAAATPAPTPTPTPTPSAGVLGVPVTGGGSGSADATHGRLGLLPAALLVSLAGGLTLGWAGRRRRGRRAG